MPRSKISAPGIVLFFVDQLSAKWLEAAMAGAAEVPNFQRLARRGVTFSNAITSNPVCCPTRATIATGLTTRQHGLLENGYQLDPGLPTFMQVLQQAGWRTGAFGKVHLQPHYRTMFPDYRPYGFDETFITEDPRGGEYLDWVREHHPKHFEKVLGSVWAVQIPEFRDYPPDGEDLAARIIEARKKKVWEHPEYPYSQAGAYIHPWPEEVSQTAWITARGLDFLDALPDEQPFFAQISYVQPHGPFNAPEYCLDLVDVNRIPEATPPQWIGDPHSPGHYRERYGRSHSPDQIRWARRVYFADIAHLDRQLGKIIDALDARGRLDNTHIVFLSDHGEMLSDQNMRGKEDKHYDACIRVPMMIAGPRVTASAVECDAIVQHEDICPTILDMAGLSMPGLPTMGPNAPMHENYPVMAGRSLLELFDGVSLKDESQRSEIGWRDAAYSGSYNAIWASDPGQWAQTIRTDRWRYTYFPSGGEQLFDLDGDPDEQRNLVDDPEYARIRDELRFRLLRLVVMQDYPRTRRNLFALGVH